MDNQELELYKDKTSWGPGPWLVEPDHIEFKSYGFHCLMHRAPITGGWCGYVAVPPDHPFYKRGYHDIDVDVHGGLTYSSLCHEPICHVPEAGEPDKVWWLGFDCAHGGDLSPRMNAFVNAVVGPSPFKRWDIYRDVDYVKSEVENLAKQLSERSSVSVKSVVDGS